MPADELHLPLPLLSPPLSPPPLSGDQTTPPSPHDVLQLRPSLSALPSAGGTGGAADPALATHVSGLLSALASHMQLLLSGLDEEREEEREGGAGGLLEAWVRLLGHSAQLTCWALHASSSSSSATQTLTQPAYDKDQAAAAAAVVASIEGHSSFSYFLTVLTQTRTHLFALLEAGSSGGRPRARAESLQTM